MKSFVLSVFRQFTLTRVVGMMVIGLLFAAAEIKLNVTGSISYINGVMYAEYFGDSVRYPYLLGEVGVSFYAGLLLFAGACIMFAKLEELHGFVFTIMTAFGAVMLLWDMVRIMNTDTTGNLWYLFWVNIFVPLAVCVTLAGMFLILWGSTKPETGHSPEADGGYADTGGGVEARSEQDVDGDSPGGIVLELQNRLAASS